MSNKEFLQEVGKGVAFGLLGMGLFILLVWVLSVTDPGDNSKERFKVVDSYGPCDVVRYTDPSNRYNYFLHCK